MDLAFEIMLLDASDDGAVRSLAASARGGHPRLADGLLALLLHAASARDRPLAELRASFDADTRPQVHPFLELPDSLKTEFVAHHRGLVAELESIALATEADGSPPPAAIKRIVHSLKGEAGMVGLGEVAGAWHDLEEHMERGASPRALAGDLLRLVSWMEAQLAVVVAGGIPTASAPSFGDQPVAAVGPLVATPAVAWTGVVERPELDEAPVASGPCFRDEETVAILGEFFTEAADGVTQADEILMRAEGGDAEPGDIDTLFRTFHSTKGVAGALELEPIAQLAHVMEDLLTRCRDGSIPFSGPCVAALLDGTQLMRQLLDQAHDAVETHQTVVMPAGGGGVLADLDAVRTGVARRVIVAAPPPVPEPEPFVMPAPEEMPGSMTRQAVTRKVASQPVQPAPLPEGVEPPPPAPAWLAQMTAIDPAAVAVSGTVARRPTMVEAPPPAAAAAPSERPTGEAAAARIRETVKVDLERVDLLVELIGELVIAESMVAGRSQASAAPELRNALRHLTKIVRDLQRMGVSLRMVPLAGVFQKMRRLVRDLCVKVGKEAQLVTLGDGIEMDRSLVEQVADPLVHILRNAMDHGLETPDERVRAGKAPQGQITLAASHEAGNIVIEVRDDGRGMNRERILARAVERGLVAKGAELADTDVYELIFAPGFSTAEKVTEVSGRGVGMDVVKRNVEAMGGRVRVDSTAGRGSTIRLTVPLTLAIIDGMLIGCEGERFVVPTRSIVESIRPDPRMLVTYAGRHEVVDVRGVLLPLVRLQRALDLGGPPRAPRDGLLLVVDGITRRFAILVDEVVSRQQVVIKAMDGRLVDTRCFSGACILADGRAGLILNIDALLAHPEGREAAGGAA